MTDRATIIAEYERRMKDRDFDEADAVISEMAFTNGIDGEWLEKVITDYLWSGGE